MKIFLDTEFYEFQPERNRVTPLNRMPGANAVQLISIGAVREDGAEFYAENADFDWDFVPRDHWLQDNVRPHLWNHPGEPLWLTTHGQAVGVTGGFFAAKTIAEKFHEFATMGWSEDKSGSVFTYEEQPPEFWGYFCDYDWVVLCGLYGRMIDLPPEFPMYCLDLKQEMHRLGVKRSDLPPQSEQAHHALADARWVRDAYNSLPDAAGRVLGS